MAQINGVTPLTPGQVQRYSRHLIMDGVGSVGQRKLIDAKVLIIGAGGLGSPVALYLALAGVADQQTGRAPVHEAKLVHQGAQRDGHSLQLVEVRVRRHGVTSAVQRVARTRVASPAIAHRGSLRANVGETASVLRFSVGGRRMRPRDEGSPHGFQGPPGGEAE